jgi:hypothetical protein
MMPDDDDDDRAEFSVCQFFPDDSYEYVLRFVRAKEAIERAKRLTESVGGRIGTIKRIIVTDGGDFTVFEWQFGKGVTFPQMNIEQRTP